MNLALDVRDVRDVRAGVRDANRPETLVLQRLCGMCGHGPTCGRAHEACEPGAAATAARATRAYECPHIPHIPHTTTAARDSRISAPAHLPAHPARLLARAFSRSCPVLKEVMEVVKW